jgi:hypothetical protein
MKTRDGGPLATLREWWRRHFDSAVRPDVPGDSDRLEHCPCCGQMFNPRDLEQALPHFEHQLGVGARRSEAAMRPQDPPSPAENVVPFRRRLERAAKSI